MYLYYRPYYHPYSSLRALVSSPRISLTLISPRERFELYRRTCATEEVVWRTFRPGPWVAVRVMP